GSNNVALGLLGLALAPCSLTGRLPANAQPPGPLPEPADTRPCSVATPAPGPATGHVYPSPSTPGTVLGFEAHGFEPNEKISMWLNVPGGEVRPLPYQAIAANDGGVLIGFRTRADDPTGLWTLVGQG